MLGMLVAFWGISVHSESISMQESYIGLGDVCEVLSETTGISHTVSDALGARKVAVFCDEVDADEFREIVAEFSGGVWVRVGDGMRLDQTAESRVAESRLKGAGRKEALASLEMAFRLVGESLEVQDLNRLDHLPKVINRFIRDEHAKAAFRRPEESAEALERLLAGRSLLFDIREAEQEADFWGIRYFADRHELRTIPYVPQSFFFGGDEPAHIGPPYSYDFSPVKEFAPIPPEWGVDFEGKSSALKESEYRSAKVGLAEHGENIFGSFGVPVIADSYRVAASTTDDFDELTGTDYLRRMVEASQHPQNEPVQLPHLVDGWLFLRYERSEILDEYEPPESQIRTMEKIVTDELRFPSLDEYIEFAKAMKPGHERLFGIKPDCLVRFPTQPVNQFYLPTLKFLGAMKGYSWEGQKRSLIGMEDLFPKQQEIALDFIKHFLYLGFPCPTELLIAFAENRTQAGLSFRFSQGVERSQSFDHSDMHNAFIEPAELGKRYQIDILFQGHDPAVIQIPIPVAQSPMN